MHLKNRTQQLLDCLQETYKRLNNRSDPVLAKLEKEIRHEVFHSINGHVEEAVLRFGLPYYLATATENNPARYAKRCFEIATNKVAEGDFSGFIYVEGFALTGGRLIHHAWVTTNGADAVEVTWPAKTDATYFGIAVPSPVLLEIMSQTEQYGVLVTSNNAFIDSLAQLPPISLK